MRLIRNVLLLTLLSAPVLVYSQRTMMLGGKPIPAFPNSPSTVVYSADPRQTGRLNEALHDATLRAGLPSLSAAIATDAGLAWSGAYGWGDIEHASAATPNSRYRTGSMAKPVTAVAMMRLVERGAMRLDAPLGNTIAGLPPASGEITPRQLASHTSGIRHYTFVEGIVGMLGLARPFHYPTVQAGLETFLGDRLRFRPGTDFLYSTWGYSLLSRRMELAARESFPVLLRQLVFDPCAMRATQVDAPGEMPGRVRFYRSGNGRYAQAQPIDTSNRIAGGGLVSTPTDLVRFARCVHSGNLLSDASLRAMWTPVRMSNGRLSPQNYGLGWRNDVSARLFGPGKPTPIIHHGGQQEGGAGFLMIVPDERLYVAVMTNSGSDEAREAAQEAAYDLVRQFVRR